MNVSALYQAAKRAAILGTHRQPLSEELRSSFPALGIREDAPPAEQLLEAISILDRLRRTQGDVLHLEPPAPPEWEAAAAGKQLSPKLVRAVQLALGDSYRLALPEMLGWVRAHNWIIPAYLLPQLLDLATAAQRAGVNDFAQNLLTLSGPRGKWLAQQHPNWQALLPPEDWNAAFQKTAMPSQRKALLLRWRREDPTAARLALEERWPSLNPKQQESILPALREGLATADIPFLRAALGPKRKEVRKLASQLLLLQGEPTITATFRGILENWLPDLDDKLNFTVHQADVKQLTDHGFNDPKLAPEGALLAYLPPDLWQTVTGYTPGQFVLALASYRSSLLQSFLRAVIFYDAKTWRIALLKHYLRQDRPQSDLSKLSLELYAQLTKEEYQKLVSWALKNVEQVFRPGSILRTISLELDYLWPDQLSKMMLTEFTSQFAYGRRAYGFGIMGNKAWKILPYRMSISLFSWLKRELYAATERDDQYGNMATKMLQVVSFRKQVHDGLAVQ